MSASSIILRLNLVDNSNTIEKRRLRVPVPDLTWLFVRARCMEFFGLEHFVARYDDDEDEEITLSSELELRDAVDVAREMDPQSSATLRLTISPMNSSAVVGQPVNGQPAAAGEGAEQPRVHEDVPIAEGDALGLVADNGVQQPAPDEGEQQPDAAGMPPAEATLDGHAPETSNSVVDSNGETIQVDATVAFVLPLGGHTVGKVQNIWPDGRIVVRPPAIAMERFGPAPPAGCLVLPKESVEVTTKRNVISTFARVSAIGNLQLLNAHSSLDALEAMHELLQVGSYHGRSLGPTTSQELEERFAIARGQAQSGGKRRRQAVDYTDGPTVTKVVSIETRSDGGLPTTDRIVALVQPSDGGPTVRRNFDGVSGEYELSLLWGASEALEVYKSRYGLQGKLAGWLKHQRKAQRREAGAAGPSA